MKGEVAMYPECARCIFQTLNRPCPPDYNCSFISDIKNRRKTARILISQLKEMQDKMAINKLRTPMFLKIVK